MFFLLVLPYGISYGYVGVALVALAAKPELHISAEQIGDVIAAIFFVHGIKFAWAPLVDTTLDRKRWYAISLGLVVLGTLATSAVPLSVENLPLLTAVAVPSQIGLTLMGMACEGLLGSTVAEADKGRASGMYQAGVLVGNGVGGGAALCLAQRVAHGYYVGIAMSVVMLFSAAGLWILPAVARAAGNLVAAFSALARDLWKTVTSRAGVTGMVIALCPVGAGAASAYFAVLAKGWGADDDVVALVNGWLGGLVSAAGAMLGGWLADRMNRRLAYALAGALTACVSLVMIVAPHTSVGFAVLTLVYSLCNGVAYATLAAFVFETVGHGAVASKYSVFISLANLATSYCIRAEGRANTRFGERGLLLTDAALTGAGIALLVVMWAMGRGTAGADDSAAITA